MRVLTSLELLAWFLCQCFPVHGASLSKLDAFLGFRGGILIAVDCQNGRIVGVYGRQAPQNYLSFLVVSSRLV
jgi:hypothetical protein